MDLKGEHFFLTTLFNSLTGNDINYCVLRNYDLLPVSTGNSDLDILVVKNDVFKFYNILNSVLVESKGKIIIRYGNITPRICIIGSYGNLDYGVQIDVHEGILPYKICPIFPVDYLLRRSILINDIKVSNDEDASVLAFFKEMFNNKTTKEVYFKLAKKAWKSNKTEYILALKDIYNSKILNDFDCLFQGSFDEMQIKKTANIVTKYLTRRYLIKVKILRNSFRKLNRLFYPPGFTIAILGTDGAGKTTIINEIKKPLSKTAHKALFYEHMRPNLIPNIAQLFGKPISKGPTINPHGSEQSGILVSLFRLFYYLFDYVFGYWIKVYPVLVRKSSIWIFDRYYYDYLIDQKRARIRLPLELIKFFKVFVPKPNLIFCLGTEPSEIFKRKPELPIEEVEKQVLKLKEFCNVTKNAFWIDTGKTIKETSSEIICIIMKNISNG